MATKNNAIDEVTQLAFRPAPTPQGTSKINSYRRAIHIALRNAYKPLFCSQDQPQMPVFDKLAKDQIHCGLTYTQLFIPTART